MNLSGTKLKKFASHVKIILKDVMNAERTLKANQNALNANMNSKCPPSMVKDA